MNKFLHKLWLVVLFVFALAACIPAAPAGQGGAAPASGEAAAPAEGETITLRFANILDANGAEMC
jgi:hypothetical protein